MRCPQHLAEPLEPGRTQEPGHKAHSGFSDVIVGPRKGEGNFCFPFNHDSVGQKHLAGKAAS